MMTMKRIAFLILFVLAPVLVLAQGLPIKDGNTGTLADVMSLAGGNPLMCAIVDTAGAQIGSFGGGTQYTEGDTDATITGTALLWEDAADTLKSVSAGTPLPITCISGCGGGTEYTVNAVAPADPVGATFVMERDDALSALTEIEGDWTNPRSNANGALWTAIDGTVAATQSGTWNINNISGTVSLPTGAATSAAQLPDGHNVTVDNAAGAGAVNIQDGGNSITVDGTVTTTPPANASTNVAQIAGTAPAAHDALMSGDAVPLTTAGFAETPEDSDANTSANRVSADADKVRQAFNRYGVAYTNPCQGPFKWTYHENSSSALTDTTVHASCGAGLKNYICSVTASTGAATAWNMFIEESTTTTILGPYYLEAVAGRGFNITFAPEGGKAQPTAATLISVTTSAAIAHSIDIQGACAP